MTDSVLIDFLNLALQLIFHLSTRVITRHKSRNEIAHSELKFFSRVTHASWWCVIHYPRKSVGESRRRSKHKRSEKCNVSMYVKLKRDAKATNRREQPVFLTDLKHKRNAQITVCYDAERRKIQVSMYKTNYNLSSLCHPQPYLFFSVCSHNFFLSS